jgi:hypothetical protein
MKEFTIKATNKKELADKIGILFNWKPQKITANYILFSNFEKIYFHNNGTIYAHFEDSDKIYKKAISLNLI